MKKKISLMVVLALLISHVVLSQTQAIWPTKGWEKSSPEKQKMDISRLSALHEKIKNGDYGYQWWLLPNRFTKSYTYACIGYGGQYLLIAPVYKLIAVFNGWNIYKTRALPLRVFYEYVYKAVY